MALRDLAAAWTAVSSVHLWLAPPQPRHDMHANRSGGIYTILQFSRVLCVRPSPAPRNTNLGQSLWARLAPSHSAARWIRSAPDMAGLKSRLPQFALFISNRASQTLQRHVVLLPPQSPFDPTLSRKLVHPVNDPETQTRRGWSSSVFVIPLPIRPPSLPTRPQARVKISRVPTPQDAHPSNSECGDLHDEYAIDESHM
ncbi:hypothetical protein B0H19DRAFT_1259292 [Mycena capillaripes]|nr:hypothetical protein B0H19DRAFT_1259292 [Mycena capillaripes]